MLENKNNIENAVNESAEKALNTALSAKDTIQNTKKGLKTAKKVGKKLLDFAKAIGKLLTQLVQMIAAVLGPVLFNFLVIILIIVIVVVFCETILSSIFGWNRNDFDYTAEDYETVMAESCKSSREEVSKIIDGYYWNVVKDVNSNVKDYAKEELGIDLQDADDLSFLGVDWGSDISRFDNYMREYAGYNVTNSNGDTNKITFTVTPSMSEFTNTIEAYLEAKYTTIQQVKDILGVYDAETGVKIEEFTYTKNIIQNGQITRWECKAREGTLIEAGSTDSDGLMVSTPMCTNYKSFSDENVRVPSKNVYMQYKTDGDIYKDSEEVAASEVISADGCIANGGEFLNIKGETIETSDGATKCKYTTRNKETVIETFDVDTFQNYLKGTTGFLATDTSLWTNDIEYQTWEEENPDYIEESTLECDEIIINTCESYSGTPTCIACNNAAPGDTVTIPSSGEKYIEKHGYVGNITAKVGVDYEKLTNFLEDEKESAVKALAALLYDNNENEANSVFSKMFSEEIEGIANLCQEDLDMSIIGASGLIGNVDSIEGVAPNNQWIIDQYISMNSDGTYSFLEQSGSNDKEYLKEKLKTFGISATNTDIASCALFARLMFKNAFPTLNDTLYSGNGNQAAGAIVDAFPEYFSKATSGNVTITAGSIISLAGGNGYYTSAAYGHVMFVNAIYKATDGSTIYCISDGGVNGVDFRVKLWTQEEFDKAIKPYVIAIAVYNGGLG